MTGMSKVRSASVLCATLCTAVASAAATATEVDSPPIDLAAELTVDAVSLAGHATDGKVRVLTNLDLVADADLGQLTGWHGARAHVYVLDNRGARPNEVAGTLQGIDNIEVPSAGTRLFEAWIEQALPGGGGLLAGLYDVNSEFYVSEAASVLVAPPFGIGSELAATGPNGPSIFPSSALAVRLQLPISHDRGQVRLAVLNAHARTIGDNDGIDLSFRDGLLVIGEGTLVVGPVKAGGGAWRYTKRRASPFEPAPAPSTARAVSQGAYAMVEAQVFARDAQSLAWFARAGLSAGYGSPFSGGYQTGLTLTPALSARPQSGFSLGMHRAYIHRLARQALQADLTAVAGSESALAVTYADEVVPGFGLQGDFQRVRHPGGNAAAPSALVMTLRATISL
jgi:porin